MILIIDNYDSFVHNLARYVRELGEKTIVIRNDKTTITELKKLSPKKIILSPGPCTPTEAGICCELISTFTTTPILGICLGHQAIAQSFGGNITKANRPLHGQQSQIYFIKNSILFNNIPDNNNVARYHSLVAEQYSLPSCLTITALSKEQEIMALEHKNYPIYGLQFHPESILTEYGYIYIKNFLNIQKLKPEFDNLKP